MSEISGVVHSTKTTGRSLSRLTTPINRAFQSQPRVENHLLATVGILNFFGVFCAEIADRLCVASTCIYFTQHQDLLVPKISDDVCTCCSFRTSCTSRTAWQHAQS